MHHNNNNLKKSIIAAAFLSTASGWFIYMAAGVCSWTVPPYTVLKGDVVASCWCSSVNTDRHTQKWTDKSCWTGFNLSLSLQWGFVIFSYAFAVSVTGTDTFSALMKIVGLPPTHRNTHTQAQAMWWLKTCAHPHTHRVCVCFLYWKLHSNTCEKKGSKDMVLKEESVWHEFITSWRGWRSKLCLLYSGDGFNCRI